MWRNRALRERRGAGRVARALHVFEFGTRIGSALGNTFGLARNFDFNVPQPRVLRGRAGLRGGRRLGSDPSSAHGGGAPVIPATALAGSVDAPRKREGSEN